MQEITVGSRVQTNRDLSNKLFKKGIAGTVTDITTWVSDIFLMVKLDSGETIRTSWDDRWSLIE